MLSPFLTFLSCFASGSLIIACSSSVSPSSSISIKWEVKREGRRLWLEEVSCVLACLIFRFLPQNNSRREGTRQMDELWCQPLWQGFSARCRRRDRQEQYISEAWGACKHAFFIMTSVKIKEWQKCSPDFYPSKSYIFKYLTWFY